MLKFHWMQRHTDLSSESLPPDEMIKLSNIFNEVGYESVLFTYNSTVPDNFIKAAYTINKNHKFKYMFAIRPYTVNSEYLAMMCQSFNQICPNRLIINIVSGDVIEGEETPRDVEEIEETVNSVEKRAKYLKTYLSNFDSMKVLKNRPEVYVSGSSDKVITTAVLHSDAILCTFSRYIKVKALVGSMRKIIVNVPIVVRDTNEEAEEFLKMTKYPRIGETIWGTKEKVKEELLKLDGIAITDIIVNAHDNDDQIDKIHEMLNEIINNNI